VVGNIIFYMWPFRPDISLPKNAIFELRSSIITREIQSKKTELAILDLSYDLTAKSTE
jgi:hypothetical protein